MQLRRQLLGARDATNPALRVEQASAELWYRAADRSGTELRPCTVATLERAAGEVLGRGC